MSGLTWWERSGLSAAEARQIQRWLYSLERSWRGAHGGKHSASPEKLNKKRFSARKRRELMRGFVDHLPRNISKKALVAVKKDSPLMNSLFENRKKSWKSILERQDEIEIDCTDFSFIDDPQKTIRTLCQIAEAEANCLDVRLNFDDPYCLDVGPFLILEEMWRKMIPVFSGGRMKRSIGRVLEAVGLRKSLGWSPIGRDSRFPEIIPFEFYRQQRPEDAGLSQGIEPPRAAVIATKLVTFIDQTLCSVANVQLANGARRSFKNLVGEILDNAQTHGTSDKKGSFTITGFLAQRDIDGCTRYRFHLGSGLIDHNQKMTVAAMHIAEKKVWAQRS